MTHPNATNEHLIMWIFEDYLKKTFWKFVQLLKVLSDDPVVHVRHRMLGFISELMSSKPEQENTLLEMLVNKMVKQRSKMERVICSTKRSNVHLCISHYRVTTKTRFPPSLHTNFSSC